MAATRVQSTSAQNAAATAPATFGTAVSADNVIFVAVSGGNTNAISVSDSAGNTYTPVRAAQTTTGGGAIRMFTARIVSGGGTAITVTAAQTSSPLIALAIYECTGVDTTTPVDQSATFQDTTGAATETIGPLTPTRDGELIIVFAAADTSSVSTFTAGTGYTEREIQLVSSIPVLYTEDQEQITAASISGTINNSNSIPVVMQMVTLQPPSAGPSTAQISPVLVEHGGGYIGRILAIRWEDGKRTYPFTAFVDVQSEGLAWAAIFPSLISYAYDPAPAGELP